MLPLVNDTKLIETQYRCAWRESIAHKKQPNRLQENLMCAELRGVLNLLVKLLFYWLHYVFPKEHESESFEDLHQC